MVDEDTQTTELTKSAEIETQTEVAEMNATPTQTEIVGSKVAITQTIEVEYNDEDCQTEEIPTYSREVQCNFKPEMVEIGTDPDLDILEAIEKELTKKIEEKFRKMM